MDENTKRMGNITLRSRALRLLEDVGSNLNIADLKSVIDKYGFTYHEFTPTKENMTLLGVGQCNIKIRRYM